MKQEDLTVCELFAGVGGFHLGLGKSGWKVVWASTNGSLERSNSMPSNVIGHISKVMARNVSMRTYQR